SLFFFGIDPRYVSSETVSCRGWGLVHMCGPSNLGFSNLVVPFYVTSTLECSGSCLLWCIRFNGFSFVLDVLETNL
ncbi:1101_t:CDS:2, partial [Gigaspora rosea]